MGGQKVAGTMKKLKKSQIVGIVILSTLLLALLYIAIIYFTPDKMEYIINSDGETCTVTGTNNEYGLVLRIPKKIDGYTVTGIGSEAFKGHQMRIVVLPSTIKKIGEQAFYECSRLSVVNGINVCFSLESIEDYAFAYCHNITKMRLPSNVKKIGDYAFYGLTLWRDASIPSDVQKIGSVAYSGCFFVTEFHIPKSVEIIGDLAFLGCSILESITVDDENPYWTSIDGVLYSKDEKTLYCYPTNKKNESFTVPEGVVNIYLKAFGLNSDLKEINLPSTIKKIDEQIFVTSTSYKTNIATINYDGTIKMWQSIQKPNNWGDNSPDFTIYCTDGQIAKDGTVTYN